MANGTRLTSGHYAGKLQQANSKLRNAVESLGPNIPEALKKPAAEAKQALEDYKAARAREDKAKEKRDTMLL